MQNKNSTEAMLEKVLARIKPSEKEMQKEQEFAHWVIEKIKQVQPDADVVLAGSIARNTHLARDKDIDIFVLFPQKLERKEFEKKALAIGKKAFPKTKWQEVFTEHPYVRGEVNGMTVEIVPSYKVQKAEQLQSAVDRSPFHTKYLVERLSEKQKDQVRLLRQFLKGINAYGAEIRTESFPGYVTELLVLNYGSFIGTLQAVSQWKKFTVIDIEKQVQEKEALILFDSPLVIIDPVDKNRNVAAALSINQMARFVVAAREFLKKPNEKFFFGGKQKPLSAKQAQNLAEKEGLIVIETGYTGTVPDIAWGQLKRFAKRVCAELEQKDFTVLRKEVFTNEKNFMAIVIDLEANVLEKAMKRTGPEAFDAANAQKFLDAHKKALSGPRIEEGRFVIETERPEWNAQKFLQKLLVNAKKTEKEPLKNALRKKAKVLTKKEVIQKYAKDKEFREFFSGYLLGKESFL